MAINLLNNDMLLYLANHYFTDNDCLALSLSGVSDRFADLYGFNRESLNISRVPFIAAEPWKAFFKKSILPTAESITLFDASHLYWLPAEDLTDCIVTMTNLEVLWLHGTKISLMELPKIFEACPKLSQLSFTLAESNMNRYQEGVMEKSSLDSLSAGFSRLTHLKLFILFVENDAWLVILGVLKWCRDCVDLFMELTYVKSLAWLGPWCLTLMENEIFPHLGWVRSLKSLVVVRRCRGVLSNEDNDDLGWKFIRWIFSIDCNDDNPLLPTCLERIWLDGPRLVRGNRVIGSSIISFNISDSYVTLDDGRFNHLEHLGGIFLFGFQHLPHLKYVQGKFYPERSDEFLKFHSMLEHLHIDTLVVQSDEDDYFGGNWTLFLLKVLVFKKESISSQIAARMVNAFPNVEQLHVGLRRGEQSWHEELNMVDFFSTIRFHKLKLLTITQLCLRTNGGFSSLLPSISERCPNIQGLHLEGCFLPDLLFSNLGNHLPLAINLRDLRLERRINRHGKCNHLQCSEMSPRVHVLLKDLQKSSPKLERIVLHFIDREHQGCPFSRELEEFIFNFVGKMEHLVVFCLVGFQINTSRAEEIKKKLNEIALPLRPSFWCYFGLDMVEGNDPEVPTIHYDEIIDPTDWYYAPPPF